jgi:DMSO reductase family type II enzyme chaperone
MKEFISQEEYRRDCYKVLADCYYLPDEGLLKTLKSLDKSRGNLQSELASNAPALNNIAALRVDYSKLFMGPYKLLAPPYGSVYLENTTRVMGDSTLDVKNRYAEEGLHVDLKEAPDHIAIELEFMYFLICKEVEAVMNSDSANTASYLRKQKDFLEVHLSIWVPDFVHNVEANAQTSFYANLARLTGLFVKEDLKSLSDTSPMPFPSFSSA